VTNKSDAKIFSEYISYTLIGGSYSSTEQTSIAEFIKKAYRVQHLDFELSISEAGYFELVKSKVFGRAGEYVPIAAPSNLVDGQSENEVYIGVDFELDFGGLFAGKEQSIALVQWQQFDTNGNLIDVSIRPIIGQANDFWGDYLLLENIEKGSSYQLSIYDAFGNVKYDRVFVQ